MSDQAKEKDDYQFMNERIVPKRKNKILKRLGTAGFVILMAVVFGVVANIVMLTSEDILREWLGIEEGERQPVDLNRPSPSPTKAPATPSPTEKPSPKPTPTVTPEPTKAAEKTPVPTEGATQTEVPTETEAPTETPEPTESLTPSPTEGMSLSVTPMPTGEEMPSPTAGAEITQGAEVSPEPTGDAQGMPEPTVTPDPMSAYLQVHDRILQVAEEISSSLVVVEAIEEGVDWFQEIYVTRTRTTGLILGNDGVDLLILVDIDRISGANLIDIYFGETVLAGRVYSMDKSYGLAVVAVPLATIPAEVMETVKVGILATEEAIRIGTPVIAVGAPNGYENSLEFGMITSLGSTISVTDGQVSYFTTDMVDRKNGYGFVVNLDGEILGMITHTLKADTEDGIFSVVSLNAMQGVILKLLNHEEQGYFGIKGQDLPKSMMVSYGLSGGVYINEVENSSPALHAGIKAGDIIVSVAGVPVNGIDEFNEVLLARSTREIVVVKLMRRAEDGMREMTVEVPLAAKN